MSYSHRLVLELTKIFSSDWLSIQLILKIEEIFLSSIIYLQLSNYSKISKNQGQSIVILKVQFNLQKYQIKMFYLYFINTRVI